MAHLRVLSTIAGFGLALSLAVASGAGAQPGAPTTSLASPTPPPASLSDAQIRSEARRLNTMKMDCLGQAQLALTAQRAATTGGRLAEADTHGRTLKDKMACADKANQDLLRLQTQAGPTKAALFVSEDRFHQEYRQGLQAQLGVLQRLSEQLADRDAVTYETFTQQVDALRRQTETLRNRYIRLLNEADTRDLAKPIFQASDLLVASAQTWKDEIKAESDMIASKGASAQLSRVEAARDTARKQRADQWEAARRLIAQAAALVTTR